jgi:hypothetical protein
MPETKRIHFYHADACALGGHFERPITTTIHPQASLSLSPAGGYGTAHAEKFRVEGVLSFESANSQVSGSLSPKPGRGWITLVSSTVEGLNILDVVTADKVTSQISTEHPLVGDYPKVTFLGTHFENLRIGGHHIDVELDLNICNQGSGYPATSCLRDKNFLARVSEQYRHMNDANNAPDWAKSGSGDKEKDKAGADWVSGRYQPAQVGNGNRSSVLCSVVKQTHGKFPGRPFGHVLDIPNFGRVTLGQLLVDDNSYRLTMISAEMGCIGDGQTTASTSGANGTTHPP